MPRMFFQKGVSGSKAALISSRFSTQNLLPEESMVFLLRLAERSTGVFSMFIIGRYDRVSLFSAASLRLSCFSGLHVGFDLFMAFLSFLPRPVCCLCLSKTSRVSCRPFGIGTSRLDWHGCEAPDQTQSICRLCLLGLLALPE